MKRNNKPTNSFLRINQISFLSLAFTTLLIIQSRILMATADDPPIDVFVKITAEETTFGKSLTILNITNGLGSKFLEDGVDVTGSSSNTISKLVGTLLDTLSLNRNSNIWIDPVGNGDYYFMGRLTPKGLTLPAAYNPSGITAIKVPGIRILCSIPRTGLNSNCPIPLDCIPYFNEFVKTTNNALNNYGKKVVKNTLKSPERQMGELVSSIPFLPSLFQYMNEIHAKMWGRQAESSLPQNDPNEIVGVDDGGTDGASWVGAGESGSWGPDIQKTPSKPISSTPPPTGTAVNYPEMKSHMGSQISKTPFDPNHLSPHQSPQSSLSPTAQPH